MIDVRFQQTWDRPKAGRAAERNFGALVKKQSVLPNSSNRSINGPHASDKVHVRD